MTPRGSPIRVFLAEDEKMMRGALATLISLEDDLEVVGEASRGDEAVDLILTLRPDVAVLDIDMPGMDGLEAAARLSELAPECNTLVLTALNKPGALQRALRAKVRGYVVKYAPAEQLFEAIRSVARGERVVDSSLALAALETGATEPTSRELEVARLLAGGKSARQVARQLHLSEGTVRNYTSKLMSKCGAQNRVDLIRIARERGWI